MTGAAHARCTTSRSERQLGIEFDFAQYYAGPYLRDRRDLENAVVKKRVIGFDIRRDDFQDVIGFACSAVALGHLGAGGDLAFELLDAALGMPRKVNMRERANMQAQFFAIEQCCVALDHARLLHILDTPPARRAGQPHLIGYFLNRTPGIQLQESQDLL